MTNSVYFLVTNESLSFSCGASCSPSACLTKLVFFQSSLNMATNQLCREATEVHDPIEELKRLVASRNKLPSTQEVKVCEERK